MSAFLGKIHYWLFNKILLHEDFIAAVAVLAKSKGDDADVILNESYAKYGYPVQGALEEHIDHENIHGWLQERIGSVESRLAYVVTKLLQKGIVNRDEVAELFRQNARATMKHIDHQGGTAQEFFGLINDYMLEGMPCDRVSEMISTEQNKVVWETTRCLHQPYWDSVGGDVKDFYHLRSSWINGFLEESGTGYCYSRTEDGVHTISGGIL